MNTEEYKQMLLAKREELLERMDRTRTNTQDPGDEGVHDAGDASVDDEQKDRTFSELDRDSTLMEQVEDALLRIEKGTFGKCEVDGRPIEEKRLKQVPWAVRCVEHQRLLEEADPAPATL